MHWFKHSMNINTWSYIKVEKNRLKSIYSSLSILLKKKRLVIQLEIYVIQKYRYRILKL